MPIYQIDYKADASHARTNINDLIATLNVLEAKIDIIHIKLGNFGNNLDTTLATAQVARLEAAIQLSATTAANAQARLDLLQASVRAAATGFGNLATNANAAAVAMTATGASFQSAATHGNHFLGTMTAMVAAQVGMEALRATVQGMADAIAAARQFAKETAEEAEKLQHAVRELRATKGGNATTESISNEVKGLMVSSGATQAEAVSFDLQWESTIQAAKDKGNWGLNEKETKSAKIHALQYAQSIGLNPKLAGEIVPMIAISDRVDDEGQLMTQFATMANLAMQGVGVAVRLITVGLPGLRQQNQRGGIGGLQ